MGGGRRRKKRTKREATTTKTIGQEGSRLRSRQKFVRKIFRSTRNSAIALEKHRRLATRMHLSAIPKRESYRRIKAIR